MDFRWNDWNIGKVLGHNVSPLEAECVARNAMRPYPLGIENGKQMVRGQTSAGDFIQVVYLIDPDGIVFVIHARPLRDIEKKQLRRKKR